LKKTSLGYIPSSKGERSIANMELLPKFIRQSGLFAIQMAFSETSS